MASTPTNLALFADSLKNVLIWDKMPDADHYYIYWDTSTPVNIFPVETFPGDSYEPAWSLEVQQHGDEEAIVSGGSLRLEVVSQAASEIDLEYQYVIPAGDFTMTVDFANFTNTGGSGEFRAGLECLSSSGTDLIRVLYTEYLSFRCRITFIVNGATTGYAKTSLPEFEKIRIERSGTTAKTWAYYSSQWNSLQDFSFGSRIANIQYVRLKALTTATRTGYADFDNVTVSPAANGQKITVTDYVYEHVGLTAGTTYYYKVASVQEDSESVACSEDSSVPLAEQAQYAQLTNDDRSTIINLRVSTQEETDEDFDSYSRANDGTMKHYNIGSKKRFVVTFKNLNASDAADLITLYNLRETLFFHRQRTGQTLTRVKFKGPLNIHTPTNKSKMFVDSIYEGSMILEEAEAA